MRHRKPKCSTESSLDEMQCRVLNCDLEWEENIGGKLRKSQQSMKFSVDKQTVAMQDVSIKRDQVKSIQEL